MAGLLEPNMLSLSIYIPMCVIISQLFSFLAIGPGPSQTNMTQDAVCPDIESVSVAYDDGIKLKLKTQSADLNYWHSTVHR